MNKSKYDLRKLIESLKGAYEILSHTRHCTLSCIEDNCIECSKDLAIAKWVDDYPLQK